MGFCSRLAAARFIGGLLIFSTAQFARPALACMAVGPKHARVEVMDETAVIVWDAPTHTERFVRRATFNATSKDFGFLVPTPSVPTLTKANDALFLFLDKEIQPATIEIKQTQLKFNSLLFPLPQAAGVQAASTRVELQSVKVLSTQHVAGYDAVVLSAENAGALGKWLQSHGYVSRPSLLAWLAPYIEQHWKITAFKISKTSTSGSDVASSAVQMTFTADRPFFPYREPADQRAPGQYAASRSLRVFLLSSARMGGTLGHAVRSRAWPGKIIAAIPIPAARRTDFGNICSISASQLPANLWLTTFEDRSSPRPGTADVYFSPSTVQDRIVPSPIEYTRVRTIVVPVEPLVLVGGAVSFFWMVTRRKHTIVTKTAIASPTK